MSEQPNNYDPNQQQGYSQFEEYASDWNSDYMNDPYQGYGQGYGQGYPGYGMGYGQPYYNPNAKSKVLAGLLGIFFGSIGVHRFYLGYVGVGIVQLLVTIVTFGFGGLWGFVEGIMILLGVGITTDMRGIPLR